MKRKKQQQDAVGTAAAASAAATAAAAQTAKGNFALNYYFPFMQSIRVRPLRFSAGLRHVLLPPQTHTHTYTLSQNFRAQGTASGGTGRRGCQGWFCGWLPLCELVCATSKEIAIASHDATKCTEKGATNNRNNDSVNDNNKKGKTQQQQQDVDAAAAAAAEPNQDWEKEAGGKNSFAVFAKIFMLSTSSGSRGGRGSGAAWQVAGKSVACVRHLKEHTCGR